MKLHAFDNLIRVYVLPPFFVYGYLLPKFIFYWVRKVPFFFWTVLIIGVGIIFKMSAAKVFSTGSRKKHPSSIMMSTVQNRK